MSIENNKAIVRQLVEEIINQGDLGLADEVIAPGFIEHEELPPGIPAGREGFKVLLEMMHAAFPDFNVTIEDLFAEGDRVALYTVWSGTHEGEFMGIPATGNYVSFQVFDILSVVDDQIAEHWGLMDSMGLMQQLGALPG